MSALNAFLDQLCMHNMGKGSTQAHNFLQDRLGNPLRNSSDAFFFADRRHGNPKFFRVPKEHEMMIMWDDGSGVYVMKDGFCTIAGTNIRAEVESYEEIHNRQL